MSPHDRLKDSLMVDPALNFPILIDCTFDLGAQFRANFSRSGQSRGQLVVGGDRVSLIVPVTMENQRVASVLSFKNARKQPSFDSGQAIDRNCLPDDCFDIIDTHLSPPSSLEVAPNPPPPRAFMPGMPVTALLLPIPAAR